MNNNKDDHDDSNNNNYAAHWPSCRYFQWLVLKRLILLTFDFKLVLLFSNSRYLFSRSSLCISMILLFRRKSFLSASTSRPFFNMSSLWSSTTFTFCSKSSRSCSTLSMSRRWFCYEKNSGNWGKMRWDETARHGTARHGTIWHDTTRHDTKRNGTTQHERKLWTSTRWSSVQLILAIQTLPVNGTYIRISDERKAGIFVWIMKNLYHACVPSINIKYAFCSYLYLP